MNVLENVTENEYKSYGGNGAATTEKIFCVVPYVLICVCEFLRVGMVIFWY